MLQISVLFQQKNKLPRGGTMHICIHCTERCNTGCLHCNFDSKPSGEEMSLDVIRDLRKSIKKNNEPTEIIFTGSGEPLMWSELPKATRLLQNTPGVNISLITSGCLNKNDDRFAVLKESLGQAYGKIHIEHSFNLFSPSFPKRLEFTLPFVLEKTAYRDVFVKMTSGLQKNKDGIMCFLFDEVVASLENSLKVVLGNDYRKLIFFSAKQSRYNPEALDPFLRKEYDASLEGWFETKTFQTPTIYAPNRTTLKNSRVISFGHWLSLTGRAKKFFPNRKSLSHYNFGKGLSCGALSECLELSPNGKFILCPDKKDFPPFSLGEAGSDLKKVLQRKKRIANKDLHIQRQEISELGDDPCDNCIRKAWEVYYGL